MTTSTKITVRILALSFAIAFSAMTPAQELPSMPLEEQQIAGGIAGAGIGGLGIGLGIIGIIAIVAVIEAATDNGLDDFSPGVPGDPFDPPTDTPVTSTTGT